MALSDFESHFLTFIQIYAAITTVVDLTEMNEYVVSTVLRGDKPKAFFAVEPFNGSVD